jgi:ABC-type transporter Mla subunit MlaD
MGRLRREALQTMDQAQAALDKADNRLDDAGELIEHLQTLAGIGLNILQRLDRISAAIEANGAKISGEVAGIDIPASITVKPGEGVDHE